MNQVLERVNYAELTRKVWEDVFGGEWDEIGPKKLMFFREMGFNEPNIKPEINPSDSKPYPAKSIRATKVTNRRQINPMATITWRGRETVIGYNISHDRDGKPIKKYILMERGQVIVDPKRNPGLAMYLMLTPKNADSPVYNPKSNIENPDRTIQPDWKQYDASAEVMLQAKKAQQQADVIAEVYTMKPPMLETIMKAMGKEIPEKTGNFTEDVMMLRYAAKSVAETSPKDFQWYAKNVDANGIAIIHDARMANLIGHNNGHWWVTAENGLSKSPLVKQEMPKQPSDVEENIWAIRMFKDNYPDVLDWIKKKLNMEDEVEETPKGQQSQPLTPEQETQFATLRKNGYEPNDYKWDEKGLVILKKNGDPDSRYHKEFKS